MNVIVQQSSIRMQSSILNAPLVGIIMVNAYDMDIAQILKVKSPKIISHLTDYDREQIEYYIRLKLSIREIGRKMNRNHTVISREIRRNMGTRALRYSSKIAICIEQKRRQRNKGRKLEKDEILHRYVVEQLKNGFAPDVIAGRMKVKPITILNGKNISHESIYQYIYEGEGRNEGLYHYLPNKQPKRQKRHTRKAQNKAKIPFKKSIHERPIAINNRTDIAHWRSDSIVNSLKRGPVISVQHERLSRLTKIHKVPNKSSEATLDAIMMTIDSLPEQCFKTMTFDNGTENAKHHELTTQYGIQTYFTDTFSSWQKGGVENANRIIRRYISKTQDLSAITDGEIYEIQERINDTPRKCLKYLTPNEVMKQYINEVVHY